MIHSLTDCVATISIPKSEYEDLIRDSEKLRVVKRVVSTKYATVQDVKSIVGDKEGED